MSTLTRRDLVAIVGALLGVSLIAWAYLLLMSFDMNSTGVMPDMQIPEWTAEYFLMMFLMWAIMMVGMMLPSVAPTVLIYAAVSKKAATQGSPIAPTLIFVSGYIAMWIMFSLLATCLQWGLDEASLLSPMMVSNSAIFGACLLITAGIYQWLPIKDACLRHCRSPVEFISRYWQAGHTGAFLMGVHHGIYCVGCCWVLMGLLFFGGVMNLLWIATITLFVLLEKVLPFGDIGGRVMGTLMLIVGIIMLFH
jgi:predicted metal-binding membrane protein